MFRIYSVSLEVVRQVVGLARQVERQDRDLARQMRRAAMSVSLNLSEGSYSRGGNRTARFHDAMGSAKETVACLEVAVAAEYLSVEQVAVTLDQLDRVVATAWRLVRGR